MSSASAAHGVVRFGGRFQVELRNHPRVNGGAGLDLGAREVAGVGIAYEQALLDRYEPLRQRASAAAGHR